MTLTEMDYATFISSYKMTSRIEHFAQLSISPNTKRAYECDWKLFQKWCVENGKTPLPANDRTVAEYLAYLADSGIKINSIVRKITSISVIHKNSKYENPTKSPDIRAVIRGIKREIGQPPKKTKALMWIDVKNMINQTDVTYIGLRDASLLALGWSSALRRSELVNLQISDLEFCNEGILITVKRSKTDQDGIGTILGIPRGRDKYCPVSLTESWLQRRGSRYGDNEPLYTHIGCRGRGMWIYESKKPLHDRMISLIVKKYAHLAGINTTDISAHSLRRGLATEASSRGVPERVIARHTRHNSIAILREYIDAGTIWTENPLLSVYKPGFGPLSGPLSGLE